MTGNPNPEVTVPDLTRCSCGNVYRLDDELTGEKIRCVGCGEKLRVGEDSRRDPDRDSTAPRRSRSRRDDDDDRDDRDDDRPVRKRKRRRRQSAGPKVGWIVTVVGLAGTCGLAGILFVLALAHPALAILPLAVGVMFSLVGNLWILGLAFKEDPWKGMLCLCLPIYTLIFIINNFEEAKIPFVLQLIGGTFIGISAAAGGPMR